MKTKTIQKQFKRKESKYIVDKKVFAAFAAELAPYMVEDDYARSTITNLYFDTPDFAMIRDALAKQHGREKIRMRVYDAHPSTSSSAFLEIKKKENKIGYKHRLVGKSSAIMGYVETGRLDGIEPDGRVTDELRQLRVRYGSLAPKMYIYYERQSFKGKTDAGLRITVDQNLIYRDRQVNLELGQVGFPLLSPHQIIMEIKVAEDVPAWLSDLLVKYQIEKVSFSKYGTAYRLSQRMKGDAYGDAVVSEFVYQH